MPLFQKADSLFLLFDRFSSVQLLGDLLFHISGVTGKMTTETASEDDNFGTAASNKVRMFKLYFLLVISGALLSNLGLFAVGYHWSSGT